MRIAVLAFALLATPALAAPFEDLDRLERRLLTALDAGIGQPGGPVAPIDRRLKLAACPQPVAIDPPALGAVALRCAATGWRIRVPLVRLSGLTATTAGIAPVREEPVVRRGDPVELVAGTRGFSVSASAIAQEDGAPGSRIRVKADPKQPPVFAEVIGAGRVRLPGYQ